jgi:hypothetical protein
LGVGEGKWQPHQDAVRKISRFIIQLDCKQSGIIRHGKREYSTPQNDQQQWETGRDTKSERIQRKEKLSQKKKRKDRGRQERRLMAFAARFEATGNL